VFLNEGDGMFQAKRSYGAGGFPKAVAIADLTGDGKPDLATANSGADTVSVLINIGDGRFDAKLDYRTGREPVSVAIGDLNADGKPDLATANESSADSVSVLLNRGDGTFQAKHDYGVGRIPSSVAIGDLSGDGKPDLAAGGFSARFVSVLVNRGDGSFPIKRKYAAWSHSVAIGDLNGDGNADLVAGGKTVSVRISKGDGSFRARRDYLPGYFADSIAIGDLNGGNRERRREQRLCAPEQGRRQLQAKARLRNRLRGKGSQLGRYRRSERRREAGPRDPELLPIQSLRTHQHARPLRSAGRQGPDSASREADARARQLPCREDPPRPLLLEDRPGPRYL
jgi:hypothetical protein